MVEDKRNVDSKAVVLKQDPLGVHQKTSKGYTVGLKIIWTLIKMLKKKKKKNSTVDFCFFSISIVLIKEHIKSQYWFLWITKWIMVKLFILYY